MQELKCGGKGTIFITGEVTSNAVDVVVTKQVLQEIGYNQEYDIINNIGRQSQDISIGVDNGGAGDQGMMFGYACNDNNLYIPTAMLILQEFSVAYEGLKWSNDNFLPDGKAQITGVYDDDFNLVEIKDFVISYQNKEEKRQETDAIIMDLQELLQTSITLPLKNFISIRLDGF